MDKMISGTKTILVMQDGTEKDVTDRFALMTDDLFARIRQATANAGRPVPVSYKMVHEYRDATPQELDEMSYCDHRDKMAAVVGY